MVQAAAPLLLALFKERTVKDRARIMDENSIQKNISAAWLQLGVAVVKVGDD